jgi:hypothetical protein
MSKHISAAVLIFFGTTGAALSVDLPTYEIGGFTVTPHQLAVVGPADVRERSPTPTLTWDGMPASPHQIAVLTARRKTISEAKAP